MKNKQIVLQLDDERYQVLVEALTNLTREQPETSLFQAYPEKERVIAEQLKGLVITQWTGSRYTSQEMEVIEAVKSNIYPVHPYAFYDTDPDKCIDCGLPKDHPIHQIDVSLETVAKIATKFDEVAHGEQESEKKVINYHEFEGLPSNPNKCRICRRSRKAKVHNQLEGWSKIINKEV